jgi:hypothetical protein
VTELDYGGRVVWEYSPGATFGGLTFAGFHHDVTRLENGNTLAMASVIVKNSAISPKDLIDDCLIEIDPTGQIVWAWYTFHHAHEFGFSDAARIQIWNAGGDWAHANAVEVLPHNNLNDERFKPGNVMVSYRNLNAVIVIDKATGAIVWKSNLTIGQHNPTMIPIGLEGAGRILAPTFRTFSRVVEMDPLTNTAPWVYTAAKSGFQDWSFFAPFISGAQRLGGGNTLVTEGTKGRIFEITRSGDIVWEYMSPFAEIRLDTTPPVFSNNVFRAYRLPFYWPFFPAPPDGGV